MPHAGKASLAKWLYLQYAIFWALVLFLMFIAFPMVDHTTDYLGPRREKKAGWDPQPNGRMNEFHADSNWLFVMWGTLLLGFVIAGPLWTAADMFSYDSGRWLSAFRAAIEYFPVIGYLQFTFLRFDSLETPVRAVAHCSAGVV